MSTFPLLRFNRLRVAAFFLGAVDLRLLTQQWPFVVGAFFFGGAVPEGLFAVGIAVAGVEHFSFFGAALNDHALVAFWAGDACGLFNAFNGFAFRVA